MMKKGPVVVAIAIILGWWGISMTRSLSSSKSDARTERAARMSGESGPVSDSALASKAIRTPAAAPVAIGKSPAAPRVEGLQPKFQFQQELNSYAALKTKVLPSPDEEAAKAALLKNASFLRSLGDRLTKVPLMAIGEQDIALDLLVEALQKGDKSAAESAIAEIVADKQVEDSKIASPVREQLAGIKAELLYHWTAYEPGQTSQVARMLPGPVSQRIWNNVLDAQKNNLAESERDR